MATLNEGLSYGDSSAKEDVVLNAVEILTARETQIMNMLPKTEAINTIHSYLVDTLQTAASAAIAEEGDYSFDALTTPTRLTNICSIIAKPFKVSRTQQKIAHYHGKNELARQTEKGLMNWANAAEFDVVRSTLVSGASGTVPKMNGLINAISKSTNFTAQTSAVVWNSTILDAFMKNCWENSNGEVATDLFMGSYLRAATDLFVQKTNMVVNAAGTSTIVRTVTSYETSFGTLMIRKHRYIQQSGDATGRILALNPQKLAIAYLEKPYIDTDLARSGPYDVKAVSGTLTIEVKNQDSNFFASGYFIG